jgi:cell division protein FtsW
MTAIRAERRRLPTDHMLINVTLALLVIGVVSVFDASYPRSLDTRSIGYDPYFFVKRQAVWAGLGFLAMVGMMRVGYWKLRSLTVPLLAVGILSLCAVWIPGIGIMRNHAARWIGWGPVQIQPSEFAKIALILYLAALLSRKTCNVRDFWDGLAAPLCVIGVLVILIEREPDLGTAAVLFMTGLTMMFHAGARKRHLTAIFLCAALLGVVAAMGFGHRTGRIQTFLNPEADYYGKGYQVTRGLIAVGSGQIVGVGIGAGREKFYLPEANTDFIFATIAEETGLVGSLLVVSLLFMAGWRGIVIARNTRDEFGALLAAGIAAMISWQAIINVAVVTCMIPATGVPLPFISYGGSSLFFLLVGIGILLNVAQHPDVIRDERVNGRTDARETRRVSVGR